MQTSIFLVNREPYCLWEPDLRERNAEFLKGLDPEYFEYSLNAHTATEDEKRASIALRTSLHHGVETLFSLIGAYVQAPDCAYAWIAKCSNADLRDLVQRVTEGDKALFQKVNISSVSWKGIAKSILHPCAPRTDRYAKIAELFGVLWARLAHELTDKTHIDEYNALKHGFRVQRGGFGIAVGIEHQYGVPPPESEMHTLGISDFGTSFFKVESLGNDKNNRSIRSRRISVNWPIERIVLLMQLTYFSINNVVSALRIVNGWPVEKCKFLYPREEEEFERPWQVTAGVTSMSIDYVVDEGNTRPVTKQELLDKIRLHKEG